MTDRSDLKKSDCIYIMSLGEFFVLHRSDWFFCLVFTCTALTVFIIPFFTSEMTAVFRKEVILWLLRCLQAFNRNHDRLCPRPRSVRDGLVSVVTLELFLFLSLFFFYVCFPQQIGGNVFHLDSIDSLPCVSFLLPNDEFWLSVYRCVTWKSDVSLSQICFRFRTSFEREPHPLADTGGGAEAPPPDSPHGWKIKDAPNAL